MALAVSIAFKGSSKPNLVGPCKQVRLKKKKVPALASLGFSFRYGYRPALCSATVIFLSSPVSAILYSFASSSGVFQLHAVAAASCWFCGSSHVYSESHALLHVYAIANFTWRWTRSQMLLAGAWNNSSWNMLFRELTDNKCCSFFKDASYSRHVNFYLFIYVLQWKFTSCCNSGSWICLAE